MPFRAVPQGGLPLVVDDDDQGDFFGFPIGTGPSEVRPEWVAAYQAGILDIDKIEPGIGISFKPARVSAGGGATGPSPEQLELQRRGLALDQLTSAVDVYLGAQRLSSENRRGAFQEGAALLPLLVSPEQEFFSGLEPGGTVQTAAERGGLPFAPVPIQHIQADPGALARPPMLEPQVGSLIERILAV